MNLAMWTMKTIGLLGLVPFLALACESGDDEDPVYNNWFCQEPESGCNCRAQPEGTTSAGSDEVDQCGEYNCCLFTDEETENALATCSCFSTSATCEQEAATRAGAEVVATCPPNAPPLVVACAAEGVNCRSDYLRQNDLEGCCAGTLCREDSNGVPVCQVASPEDLALHDRCEAWSDERFDSVGSQNLSLRSPTLSTSHGLLTLGEIGLSTFSTGPGGCLNEFDIRVGNISCGLDFSAEIVNGALSITDVSGFLYGCSGFMGSAQDGRIDSAPQLVTDFAFEGLACDGQLIYESYCLAGAFVFTLGGTVGALTIDPQTLIIEGATCGTGEASGQCPIDG